MKRGPKNGHGHTFNDTMSREYRAWDKMKQRCYNPNHNSFPNYGGRGITVCERWRNSFLNFIEDMGECPPGKSLDRKENNGNYEPANCRWATKPEQENNKHTNRRLTFQDRTQTMTQWAKECGVKFVTLRHRIDRGWPIEIALTAPAHRGHRPPF